MFEDRPHYIILAKRLASALHAKQVRKSTGRLFYTHLDGTAGYVAVFGGDDDAVAAAYLHDTLEDHGEQYRFGGMEGLKEQIRKLCGPKVLNIVEACTNQTTENHKAPWRERKAKYFQEMIPKMDSQSSLVSISDKIHNLQSNLDDFTKMGDEIWRLLKRTKEDILWYNEELLQAYMSLSFDKQPPKSALDSYADKIRKLRKIVYPQNVNGADCKL
jgi:(p)ppGpp synthase/HD superfamily hydrolase